MKTDDVPAPIVQNEPSIGLKIDLERHPPPKLKNESNSMEKMERVQSHPLNRSSSIVISKPIQSRTSDQITHDEIKITPENVNEQFKQLNTSNQTSENDPNSIKEPDLEDSPLLTDQERQLIKTFCSERWKELDFPSNSLRLKLKEEEKVSSSASDQHILSFPSYGIPMYIIAGIRGT
jgi:hypothetical protein